MLSFLCFSPVSAEAVNNSPRLRRNTGFSDVLAGQRLLITSTNLLTDDVETVDPIEIVYTYSPDTAPTNNGSFGTLLLRNVPLRPGDRFTQDDINNNRLAYVAPNTFESNGDSIPFRVVDSDGQPARDRDFTVFSIFVQFANYLPVAVTGNGAVALGGQFNGQFQATDTNRAQRLFYRLTQDGNLGRVTSLDTNTGAFTYQANLGAGPGFDALRFQVNDGTADAAEPGVFFIEVRNEAPMATSTNFLVQQDGRFTGKFPGQDADLPKTPLTFRLASNPAKGSLELNAESGEFTYVPNPGRFGYDTISYTVFDGALTSQVAQVSFAIKGVPEHGMLFVTDQKEGERLGSIAMVNPANGDVYRVLEGDFLRDAATLAFDPVKHSVLTAVGGGTNTMVIEYDFDTESPRLISQGGKLEFVLGMTLDPSGDLLLANGSGGNVLKVDRETGEQTVVASGNFLSLPAHVTVDPNGQLIVLDLVRLFEDDGRVVKVDLQTGAQSLISSNANLLDPTDVIFLPNGSYLVSGRGNVLELSPADGTTRILLGTNAISTIAKEMVLNDDGRVYIAEFGVGIVSLDPNTGAFTRLNAPDLRGPQGIASFIQPNNKTTWLRIYFSAAELADASKQATIWGDAADPDKDGVPNLAEYAFNLDPTDPTTDDIFSAVNFTESNGGFNIELSYKSRRTDNSLKYQLEYSSDLQNWTADPSQFELVRSRVVGSAFEESTYRYRRSVFADGARFFRVRVTSN